MRGSTETLASYRIRTHGNGTSTHTRHRMESQRKKHKTKHRTRKRKPVQKDLKQIWGYGHAGLGDYVNERTVNYIIKYVLKQDQQHKAYDPVTLTSKGIGNNYTTRPDAYNNRYKAGETREYYQNRQGFKLALPIYYRNKLYTEEEREKLWLEKLDKNERWVLGSRIDISKGETAYYQALQAAQRKNNRLGYGQRDMWEVKEYEEQRRTLKQKQREVNTPTLYVDTETGELFANPTKKIIHLHNLKELQGKHLLC